SGGFILESAKTFTSMKAALRGIRFLVGTTGKSGGYRQDADTPRVLAPEIIDRAAGQKIGILFGPEDTGLIDEDLQRCQFLMRIPTHSKASSLNLAQAVIIISYELMLCARPHPPRARKLAPLEQSEAMYSQLQEALLDIGFLHAQNARHMMFALRRMLGRAGLESSDVKVLRGIARQIAWYAERNK
ncbi:MAG TPA: TrmH family RNA methyltransferase, partial [Acidobacteriota bacterium]|nr:TrmH family RNA methyltransferase [Acidobacteriota bacterium]